jgi:hypothetical protein
MHSAIKRRNKYPLTYEVLIFGSSYAKYCRVYAKENINSVKQN